MRKILGTLGATLAVVAVIALPVASASAQPKPASATSADHGSSLPSYGKSRFALADERT
ncbi:MAG TPA: hypothetical protein VGF25_07515 [Thermoleophilaceae bacterium]|jgi:hypothetical protein